GATGFGAVVAGRAASIREAGSRLGLTLATMAVGGAAGKEEAIAAFVAAIARRLSHLTGQQAVSSSGLVAAAVAGGVGSACGAPLAGLAFAVERVAGRFHTGDLIAIAAAAAVGGIGGRAVGVPTVLPLANAPVMDTGWIAVAVVAVIALLVGVIVTALVGAVAESVRRLPFGAPLMTGVGGLVVAFLLAVNPILGGADPSTVANAIMSTSDPLWLVTAGGRLVAMAATLGAGAVGGVFAPVIGVGAALGAGLAGALSPVVAGASTASLAVTGAVIVLAVTLRAPFAAALLAFDLGTDSTLVVALGALAAVATSVAKRIEPASLYHALDPPAVGVALDAPVRTQLLHTTRVQDVMRPVERVVLVSTPIDVVAPDGVAPSDPLIVIDHEGDWWGLVTPDRIEQAWLFGDARTVADIALRATPTALPYQTLADAFADDPDLTRAFIPVVDPQRPRRLIGVLWRADAVASVRAADPLAAPATVTIVDTPVEVAMAALTVPAPAPPDAPTTSTVNDAIIDESPPDPDVHSV
ncbi:MAG: chloride channel protein, partial [Dehalococcoidia bacterium]|nr:chloride channel protein [Dehalococcoidia bacterium]